MTQVKHDLPFEQIPIQKQKEKSENSSPQKQHKEKKKKRDQKSRSRSREKKRSRSTPKKKKHKKQHKKHKHQSSNSRQTTYYNRSKSRQHKKHKHSSKKSKKKDIPPTQVLLPEQIPMPIQPGERRKRERSRSPLGYYRRNQGNNDGEFWDSFSWQPRINYIAQVSNSALLNTKKMRRMMITNIPFEIGITDEDLRNLITRFMADNYLKDEMNNCPVVDLEVNEEDKSVAIELSSVEETCRICKLEKVELFRGVTNGIIRLGDSAYGNNVVTQAQIAAQAQAAAFGAINVLENKKTQFNIDNKKNKNETSTVLRVTNAVTPYMATNMNQETYDEYYQDLLQGFSQYGTIVHSWFVKKNEEDICADVGNLFLQYEAKDQAELAMGEMQGRIYDERNIYMYYVPRQLYYKNFKSSIKPPEIKQK